jgi:hypothetical protein
VSAGETGRAGADHGDRLAGRRRAGKELRILRHGDVGGVALQLADLHRLALSDLAHADFFAELFGGADASAHTAQDVLLEDRLGGAERIASRDFADEQRNVDRGRTRVEARRVVAEVAAVGLDYGLVLIERRVERES